jgi:hypothetical protein
MTDRIVKHLRNGWAVYGILAAILTASLAYASLPARVAGLEERMTSVETVGRYTACVLRSQSRDMDPTPCESHLAPDVLDYLRPAGR